MKYLLTVFLLLSVFSAYSQTVELIGALFIGRSDMTKYRIFYEIKSDNSISGYSVSDFDGVLETRASIAGTYNPRKKTLHFEEKGILSTKANLNNDQFCFLTVNGNFSKTNKKTVFKGTFSSKSSNSQLVCDSGTLVLFSSQDMIEYQEKVKKLPSFDKPKPDSLTAKKEAKPTPTPAMEKQGATEKKPTAVTIKPKTIHAGSTTQYQLLSDTVQLDIFDDQKEDGDKITVLKNNEAVLTDFTTTQKTQSLRFVVDKTEQEVLFTIISTNEGTSPPNTVKVYLINGRQKSLLVAPLKKNQKVRIRLYRK